MKGMGPTIRRSWTAFLVTVVVSGACSVGPPSQAASACDDSTFVPIEGIAEGGPRVVEVQASSGQLEAWGLLWAQPPLAAGEEVKMVWRITGAGDFSAVARLDGLEVDPAWGPVVHDTSSFNKPGDEWGTSFLLPQGGCWEIRLTRGTGSVSVWIPVTER